MFPVQFVNPVRKSAHLLKDAELLFTAGSQKEPMRDGSWVLFLSFLHACHMCYGINPADTKMHNYPPLWDK